MGSAWGTAPRPVQARPDPVQTPVQTQRQRLRTRYGELLRAGVAHGSLRADDPALATDLVLGLVGSVVHLRQHRGAVEPDLFAPIVADGCLRLLRCDGRRLTAAHRRGAALLAGL
jgi:hypothetical protein